MTFTKQNMKVSHSNVFLRGQELDIVNEFKYLGVMYESTLTFKSHVKKVANKVKFNLRNFKQVRPFLDNKAAKLFLYTMILYYDLIYKVLYNLVSPPLHGFIRRLESGGSTRASVKGDCVIPFRRTTFGQNVLSIIGGKLWNSLPLIIRECPTFNTFKTRLKQWLLENQRCTHF